MEFQRPTALTTDSNGMVILERNPLDLPVFFIHNEIEKWPHNLGSTVYLLLNKIVEISDSITS